MAALVVLVVGYGAQVLAQDAMVWSFTEGNDPNNGGRMTARLGLGTPETDNSKVSGACEARSGSGVNAASLVLGADVGKLPENSNVNVRFTGGGFNHFVPGTVQGTQVEEGITGVDLTVKLDDPLWKALTEQNSLDYLVPGYRASTLELKAGHDKIRKFIAACRSYAEALNPPKDRASFIVLGNRRLGKGSLRGGQGTRHHRGWEAFLNNFPKGFRADLARAYVKRLGNEGPKPARKPEQNETASRPPAPQAPPTPTNPADLSLTVTANQKSCTGGAPCSYTVVATNTGGQPFNGQLVIANSLSPRSARLTRSSPAPWACRGMGGGAVCTNTAANIAPGQSTTISLTFTLPRNADGAMNSCASVSWGGAPTGSSVRDVQQKLNTLGYNVGRPDGKAGRKTVNAIRQFQQRAGLQATGEIDLPLLIAMFTQGGTGDANPANDQACAGAAVVNVSAPAPVKAWKPPRGYKKVPNPAATGRCSSRSVWLEGQCILKTHVASFCGPGFHRQGSRCVSNASAPAGRDGHLLNKLPACPTGTFRLGSNCIQTNQAPVFGNAGRGGNTQTQTSSGQSSQPGGSQANTAAACPYPYTRVGNKCDIVCSGGRVRYIQSNGLPSCKCKAGTVPTMTEGGWYSVCLPPGQKKPATKCPAGQVADLLNHDRCFPACSGGKVRIKGRCCAPGSGVENGGCTYYTKSQKTACKSGFMRHNNWCMEKPYAANTQGGGTLQQRPANCVSNQIRLANGSCGCAQGLIFRDGRCKKPSGSDVLKQMLQPQQATTQPQQQPQHQFQQQVNCTGGRVANANGQCECPAHLPRW
ncbi:MAG: peptidoglycan-binding protein, partial [Hyphomicrobiaceae bacterium]|nr:peptidoglycan-binding protein [Hyphomicrobiaceae bacterium]